ncbi:hypothetical protein B1L02_17220 [Pseudoalteromonas piscicida]|uniref:Uncharacterized protein n=1 Tax=Pseudoalteromonas piscicida TaxID=43662 RepID=A0AAD0RIW8_PSEO7|nr:hypothetical protein B1L02_17220 [Pseudoalteromonas piscicida]AXR03642.1 hypothetical protein D0511_17290 [Pseudoalteromonas piscicida]
MSITRRKFCYLVVLNEKFLTQLASDLLLQIEQVLRLIGIIPYSPVKGEESIHLLPCCTVLMLW